MKPGLSGKFGKEIVALNKCVFFDQVLINFICAVVHISVNYFKGKITQEAE